MQSIFVLTGAGISAESGIQTFRDADGLWEGYEMEEVATPQGFASNPRLVYEFYNLRRKKLLTVQPNAAHEALALLEQKFPGTFTLVTQNIDDLHERAGSQNIIHMHGELLKARCQGCEAVSPWPDDMDAKSICPACGQSSLLRPHIVWFGEMPLRMDEILSRLSQADLFLSVGTSGQVYPAAGFVESAKYAGAHTIEINPKSTEISRNFKEHLRGAAGEQVPALVERILKTADW